MRFGFFLLGFLTLSIGAFAQDSLKIMYATRTLTSPKIDGKLDDDCWIDAPLTSGFTQNEPYFGKPESQLTQVKMLYDNQALYVYALMYTCVYVYIDVDVYLCICVCTTDVCVCAY